MDFNPEWLTATFEELAARLAPEHDRRHIQAYIMVEHGRLGGMSPFRLAREIRIARDCIAECGVPAAEALARTFGL